MTAPQAPSLAQFFSGGGKYFPFKEIGDSITGIIETVHDAEQQTDINGVPATKADGSPKWQVRVDLATDLRSDEDDDGVRTIYVKAWMTGAIAQAVKSAGAKGLDPGGRLTVAVVAQDPPPQKGMRPVNKFAATYEPPVPGASASANAVLAEALQQQQAAPAAAPAQQVQQAPPAAAPAQAPAAPAGPPPGIDPAAWATFSPEQQAALLGATPGF